MARLPLPGGDQGSWGQILNEYLLQAHDIDGSLKSSIISETNLSPSVVAKLNAVGGPVGATGATGVAGTAGPVGATGATGVAGSTTIAGITGLQSELDNKSPLSHTHDSADIITGNIVIDRLPAGSVVYTSTITRPTARTDIVVIFTGAIDPAGAAFEGDLWVGV